MNQTTAAGRLRPLVAALLLAALAGPAHAELYKWVDAQGKTHYSDQPNASGKAQVKELRVDAAPAAGSLKLNTTPSWQKQEEEYRKRQANEAAASRNSVPAARPRREGYRSDKLETDDNRCRLARDVLSGAARHSNGAATDANDREVATRDVQSFCR